MASIAVTVVVYSTFAFWLEACGRVEPIPARDHLGSDAWVAGPGLLVVLIAAFAWPGLVVGAIVSRRRAGRRARWLLASLAGLAVAAVAFFVAATLVVGACWQHAIAAGVSVVAAAA